jgi:hypothetical protein
MPALLILPAVRVVGGLGNGAPPGEGHAIWTKPAAGRIRDPGRIGDDMIQHPSSPPRACVP